VEPDRVDLEIAEQLLQLAPDSMHRLRSPHLPVDLLSVLRDINIEWLGLIIYRLGI
jgi:hypothetical protein